MFQLQKYGICCFIILLVLIITACAGTTPSATLPPLPTSASQAKLPTLPPATPTTDQLPPTLDLTKSNPQSTPTDSVTRPPTSTPRPTRTPKPLDPIVNIINPSANSFVEVGQATVLSGLTQLNPTETIWISLITNDGRLILDEEAIVERRQSGSSNWEVALELPLSVTGIVQLRATVRNDEGEILAETQHPVHLLVNTETANRYILLDKPTQGENLIAGHYALLQGYAKNPSLNRITVEVFAEDCQTSIAEESFVVGGSGKWFGLPNLPEDVVGPACVAAYAGNRGEANWREVQTVVNILPKDDPAATGVTIVNPIADSIYRPGETISTWGVIYNAVDNQAVVSLILEDGQLLAREEVTVDRLGYWEFSLPLPADVAGIAAFDVTTGEAGDFGHAQTQHLITISFE